MLNTLQAFDFQVLSEEQTENFEVFENAFKKLYKNLKIFWSRAFNRKILRRNSTLKTEDNIQVKSKILLFLKDQLEPNHIQPP